MADIRYKWGIDNKGSVKMAENLELPQFKVKGHREMQKIEVLTTGECVLLGVAHQALSLIYFPSFLSLSPSLPPFARRKLFSFGVWNWVCSLDGLLSHPDLRARLVDCHHLVGLLLAASGKFRQHTNLSASCVCLNLNLRHKGSVKEMRINIQNILQ